MDTIEVIEKAAQSWASRIVHTTKAEEALAMAETAAKLQGIAEELKKKKNEGKIT